MTRLAIFSDAHGNWEGLLRVLEDAEAQGCDEMVCLGDLVDGGVGNEEVVREIRARGIPTVRGNHDEINDLKLSPETSQFLAGLPEAIVRDGFCFTHISPRSEPIKIRDRYEAWNVFDETPHRLTFIGHNHIPFVFGEKSREPCSARLLSYTPNKPLPLDPEDRYIVCPGSIGYPRDGVNLLRFAVFSLESYTLEIRAIKGPLLSTSPFSGW